MNLKRNFLTAFFIPLSFAYVMSQSVNSPIPENHHIEKIEIRQFPGEAGSNFNLTIFEDKRAIYIDYVRRYSKIYNNTIPQFSTTIDSTNYNLLLALLNKIEFTKLEQPGSLREALTQDNSECIITITYDNGKIKTIRDYWSDGTKDIRELYSLLSKLPENQSWKITYPGDAIKNEYSPVLQTK